MTQREPDLKESDALKKPQKSLKQKQIFIMVIMAASIIFIVGGAFAIRAKSKNDSQLNIVHKSRDIIDDVLPKPVATLPSVKERIEHYKMQENLENSDNDDVVSIVENRQKENEVLQKAHFLARIEAARIKAQEEEKMISSSALSGIGAGIDKQKINQQELDSKSFENGNTAFLAKVGTAPIKEEEAGILGDLRFRITQGKIIKGVIDGAINSDLPDTIRAHVTEDVYGDQGNIILIPNGARLIGQYRSGRMKNAQTRIFIVWTRLIEPNGISVQLSSIGSDDLGRAGMTGQVDKHSAERFGTAVLMSVISAGASLYGANTEDQYNSISQFRSSVSQSFSNMASQDLQKNINIQPTIHVNQGTPLSIKVSHDISFENVIQEMGINL